MLRMAKGKLLPLCNNWWCKWWCTSTYGTIFLRLNWICQTCVSLEFLRACAHAECEEQHTGIILISEVWCECKSEVVDLAMAEDRCLTDQLRELRIYYTE
jgi:hypothetical protein